MFCYAFLEHRPFPCFLSCIALTGFRLSEGIPYLLDSNAHIIFATAKRKRLKFFSTGQTVYDVIIAIGQWPVQLQLTVGYNTHAIFGHIFPGKKVRVRIE